MGSYTLGLDLGSASIGWAITEKNKNLVNCGVRIFDPGVDLEAFTRGQQGSSNNVVRRTARLQRRQLRRRAGRQRDLFELLQSNHLLPGSPTRDCTVRHKILEGLDAELRSAWRSRLNESGVPEQSLIYLLRRTALDQALKPFELGRIFYHLSQRRGFKSNRREQSHPTQKEAKKADDPSVVKAEIQHIAAEMQSGNCRTIGEYFAKLSADGMHVRRHWTDRKWFLAEFEAIWDAQSKQNADLNPELRSQIFTLLFHQRPIATNAHLIGKCELEPTERRAHMDTLLAQRFRYLQKLNDLAFDYPLHPVPLTSDQRSSLLETFETHADVTFDAIRKILKLDKTLRFNLERGGEKKLPGNRTNAAMLRAIPDLWPTLSIADQDVVVQCWIDSNDDEDLVANLTQRCGFALEDASALCSVHPEDRYHNLSSLAMSRLIPAMAEGVSFKTAESTVYGSRSSGGPAHDLLPPVKTALPSIPNPAVMRALTELRKVVNAIIRRYGKPAEVRIELARELKRNAFQRQRDSKNMRTRESERKAARLLAEVHCPQPSRRDIERVLLFEEGGEVCAYCGAPINLHRLFDGDIDVDHILPRNRFPDDSFANKCLACRPCNQQKLGRTPFEAFGADEERWPQILARVAKWGNRDKLERFHITDLSEFDLNREDSFASRRLNDTRYISKLAARYLGLLYGGRDRQQAQGPAKRAVFASTGMLTASLRRAWGLEAILKDADTPESARKPAKPRGDHRHHAIDAIVVALSSNAVIQQTGSVAAAANYAAAERAVLKVQPPWNDFVPSIDPTIKSMVVSHRPSHKLFGQLHEETNYSPHEMTVPGRKRSKTQVKTVAHVRKYVHTLTEKTIAEIVDPVVRQAVQSKLLEVGGDPKNLESNLPMLTTRTGKQVPIRRVRIRTSTKLQKVGDRFVPPADNHHVEIFEAKSKKRELQWDSPGIVSRLEAVQRKGRGEDVVVKSLPGANEARYLFSLMGGDTVEMDDAKLGGRNIFVVRTVCDDEITFVRHTDARKLADIMKGKERGSDTSSSLIRASSIDKLRQWNCRKVFVDVLGKVRG